MQEQQFRIGGYYKQQDGRLVQLREWSGGSMLRGRPVAMAYLYGHAAESCGGRFLDSGRFVREDELPELHLLPGELNEQGLPIGDAAPVEPQPLKATGVERQEPAILMDKAADPTAVQRDQRILAALPGPASKEQHWKFPGWPAVDKSGPECSPDCDPLLAKAVHFGSAGLGGKK